MRYALRRLYELEADEVDVDSVTNSNLTTILDRAICRNGEFVFWRSNHYDYKAHSDETLRHYDDCPGAGGHLDETRHEDHTDKG